MFCWGNKVATQLHSFLCEWDSRAREKHRTVTRWPKRKSLVLGTKNVKTPTLIDPQEVLLPSLYMKLGKMKKSVKALDRNGRCYRYFTQKFPLLSQAKMKEGDFDGPQILQLVRGSTLTNSTNDLELQAWIRSRR